MTINNRNQKLVRSCLKALRNPAKAKTRDKGSHAGPNSRRSIRQNSKNWVPIIDGLKERNTRYWRPVTCHQISCSERGLPQLMTGDRQAANGKYAQTASSAAIEISAEYSNTRLVKNLRPWVLQTRTHRQGSV